MPIRQISAIDAPKSSSNQGSQDIFRRRVLIKCVFDGYELCGPHRLLQDLGIQAQFIAEVVIDSSDIRSRSCADFANRRSLIAAVGEN
jgi:hypothetical protein